MGEKENVFNPMLEDTDIGQLSENPSGVIAHSIGSGVNVIRDADGEIIGLYDDMGNPILK